MPELLTISNKHQTKPGLSCTCSADNHGKLVSDKKVLSSLKDSHFIHVPFSRMKPGAPRAKATESNARSERELLYPFGHQNDLGHVVLTRPQVK